MSDAALLQDQIDYYRARAGEYDRWWFRTGRYDHGAAWNAAWFADAAAVEAALDAHLAAARPANAVELACGTGLFTRRLAPWIADLTAIDASPEVIALNRARVADPRVRYVEADLFAWRPERPRDLVFMSFWLSHVPDDRFDGFWATVRATLAPGGAAYVIDSAWDRTSTANNHPTPDREAGTAVRKLDDGREFRIVKHYHDPAALNARLAALGFDARIVSTPRYFLHGVVRPAG